MNKELKDKLNKKAISLESYGINDLAWNKEDALALITSIMSDRIGILGGDVYKINSGSLEPLYDNWSYEFNEMESKEIQNTRSKIKSLNYIKNYPIYERSEEHTSELQSLLLTSRMPSSA